MSAIPLGPPDDVPAPTPALSPHGVPLPIDFGSLNEPKPDPVKFRERFMRNVVHHPESVGAIFGQIAWNKPKSSFQHSDGLWKVNVESTSVHRLESRLYCIEIPGMM